jgi:hypothetical protein
MANAIVKNIFTTIFTTVATGAAISIGISFNVKVEAALIQQGLFFGRDIPGGTEVSETDFETFLNNVITPRFPDGLTVFDANGQFKNSTGTIIKEKSKYITIFAEDNSINNASIYDIGQAYIKQFNQESVLQVTNKNVKVSFGVGDLFSNPPTNKLIKTDLFFGRNIPSNGEVSEADFQTFINNVVTPSFPDGLTVFDANGQFRDSTGTIIKEKSKNLSLFFEDTLKNQASIDDIVNKYTQQFNQESVLQVLDESLNVTFITAPKPASVPEPALMWGLTTLAILGAGSALKKKVVGSTPDGKYVSVAEWMLKKFEKV